MPPKRKTTARPSGTAKRGRANAGGRSKGAKEHVRVLSDISEESTAQRPATKDLDPSQRMTRSSKKRSFQDFANDSEGRDSTEPSKRIKQEFDSTPSIRSYSRVKLRTKIKLYIRKFTRTHPLPVLHHYHHPTVPASTSSFSSSSPVSIPTMTLSDSRSTSSS